MKICFITYDIFELGGIQRVVSVIANALSKKHEIHILCTNSNCKEDRHMYNLNKNINVEINGNLINKNINSKIVCKLLKIINRKTGIINQERYINLLTRIYYPKEIQDKFIKHLNDRKYDIVVGVTPEYSLLLGVISNKIKMKTIGWQHNSFDAYLRSKGEYFWNQDCLFKQYMNKLNCNIVLTNADKKKYHDELDIESKVIYNPLSFESKEKSMCLNKNIIYVGRLVEKQKGLDLLIESFKKINDIDKECKLKIVGDGPDKAKVDRLIENYGLENNIEIIPCTNKIIEQYLDASIFVSSSRWEGFGLVITEAMECGLPVIAFENTGPKEIINYPGENGILVPRENTKLFADNVLHLIKNPEEVKRLSKNSIERAKDFKVEKIVEEWEDVIVKIYN